MQRKMPDPCPIEHRAHRGPAPFATVRARKCDAENKSDGGRHEFEPDQFGARSAPRVQMKICVFDPGWHESRMAAIFLDRVACRT